MWRATARKDALMTATKSEPKPVASPPATDSERLVVHQHSDLIYWWVVWAYGLFCALWTWLRGTYVTVSPGHKPVLVYPHAWMGISFVFLVLFLCLTVAGLVVQLTAGWTEILQFFPLLLVYMNLAFYLLFSGVLLAAWLFVVLGTDHSVYWEFGPNSIAKKYWFTDAAESYTSPQVETSRQSDDIFVHRLLGLWFLGFGTGDIEVRFSTAGGGQRLYVLKNVWRAAHVENEINRLVA